MSYPASDRRPSKARTGFLENRDIEFSHGNFLSCPQSPAPVSTSLRPSPGFLRQPGLGWAPPRRRWDKQLLPARRRNPEPSQASNLSPSTLTAPRGSWELRKLSWSILSGLCVKGFCRQIRWAISEGLFKTFNWLKHSRDFSERRQKIRFPPVSIFWQ